LYDRAADAIGFGSPPRSTSRRRVDVLNPSLIAPKGVVVIGASQKATNLGNRLITALTKHSYEGELAVVNPTCTQVAGVTSYPSISEVPFPVDLALVGLVAAGVPDSLRAAGRAGVGAAVIFSSGFAETGASGQEAQRTLADLSRELGIRILGPNCQGLVDFRSGLAACFSPSVLQADRSRLAPVAYLGQSGAVGGVFFDLARERGHTPTAWVSTGNEVDLSAVEIASDLASSGDFDLLCLYLESLPEAKTWFDLLDSADASGTRLAVLRSGTSDVGRRAAQSHTGALLGDDTAFEVACRDAGVMRVDDISDLVDLTASVRRRHRGGGGGVAVITTSGGAGGLAADQLSGFGLAVPPLQESTRESLRSLLPPFAGLANPVDVTAEFMMRRAGDLRSVTEILLADDAIDNVLLVVTNLVGVMADEVAAAFKDAGDLPLSIAYLAARDQAAVASQRMREQKVVVHESIRSAVRSLALTRTLQGPAPRPVMVGPAIATDLPSSITEWGARDLLDQIGVARPQSRLARDAEEAGRLALELDGPVVLKIQSPDVPHKTEVGGVRVGVEPAQAAAATAEILAAVHEHVPSARIEGVLVQQMVAKGVELLVGLRTSSNGYPPTITVGIGGTAVEVFGDAATAFAPLSTARAEELLHSLRGAPLLQGLRGTAPADLKAAADAIARISGLAAVPGIDEVEVNPLIVLAQRAGVVAADLLVHLA
jgi:acetate---CoA ligase (ADP-forming)